MIYTILSLERLYIKAEIGLTGTGSSWSTLRRAGEALIVRGIFGETIVRWPAREHR